MKGIGSESKRGVIVGDTTECGRETKQNERQQQGGSWGHSPEVVSKNGARRVRQRQAVMIAAIVHVQSSIWSTTVPDPNISVWQAGHRAVEITDSALDSIALL